MKDNKNLFAAELGEKLYPILAEDYFN